MKKHYDENRQYESRMDRPHTSTRSPDREGINDQIENLIRDAQESKTRAYGTPGRWDKFDVENNFVHSAMVDKTYMLVGSYLEESLIQKIENGEFVDLFLVIELKLVMKEGRTYYVPAKESSVISGFGKWEQAFRVFSNIYTRRHPTRATELIQYNHVIHTASLTYIWSNVYAYDQDFRIHMSKHPGHSWAIVLQQSWMMRLQDQVRFNDFHRPFGGRGNNKGNGHSGSNRSNRTGNSPTKSSNEPCRKYNKGKCNFGSSCQYDHKCSYCLQFGHTVLNCRKLKADLEHGSVNAKDAGEGGNKA